MPIQNLTPNNGGGLAFKTDDWSRLDRFISLGAEQTYYVGRREIAKQNYEVVKRCLAEDGMRTVARIAEFSTTGRAYRNESAIFALAVACAYATGAAKKHALESIVSVCRTGTHILHFCEYIQHMRGWGRSLRRAVADWYLLRSPEHLAFQAIKYQQRDGWKHRDVLRLCHPETVDNDKEAVLRWMVGGKNALPERQVRRGAALDAPLVTYHATNAVPAVIEACEEAKTATVPRLCALIREHNLPREAVPTERLNERVVWDALLDKMPLTAMLRNLGKMTNIKLLEPMCAQSHQVVAALSDTAALRRSRIHPLGVLIALKQYSLGHGLKGNLTWTPVPAIVDALDAAFYESFHNLTPINKPVLLAVDVSGSMSAPLTSTPVISCSEAAAAMAMALAKKESNYFIMGFDDGIRDLGISKSMRLDTVLKKISNINCGGTDCSLPMKWAREQHIDVGGFVVVTDNETNTGARTAPQELAKYRHIRITDARQVVIGMTATDVTVADPNDPLALDVAGFDAGAAGVVSDFIRGSQLEPGTQEDTAEEKPAEETEAE